MERDVLCIDVEAGRKTLRVCCSHLESLIADPPKRPHQVATAAKFMHEADASVVAGDFNAIEPFDKTLHSDNDLQDAYLACGGTEDDPAGMTWGQMAAPAERNKFGLSRMDKLFFCGALSAKSFELFGQDVEVADAEIRSQLMEKYKMEKGWVTDHLGVKAIFSVINEKL